jgi:GAF domain-containing protein
VPLAGLQRDRIVSVSTGVIEGQVDVWLHENVFRLPDWDNERLFPTQPPLDGMRRAIQRRHVYVRNGTRKSVTTEATAAVPLEDQGFLLGALQVTRPQGPRFTKEELALLEGLARIVAVGLYASHRVEVERFRLGQLNLVREVSAQIANVLDVDELARRVTQLIQRTFHFYYVGILTLERGSSSLRYRSSASAPRKGRQKAPGILQVEIGQGLIGRAAGTGTRIVCDDVRAEPHYRFVDGCRGRA